MAARRRSNSSSGFKNTVLSGLVLLIVGGAILAWVNVNNITSFNDALIYFRGWSDKAIECTEDGGPEGYLKCQYLDGTPAPSPSELPDKLIEGGTLAGESTTDNNTNNDEVIVEETINVDEVNAKLAELTLTEPLTVDYVRSDWKHWIGSPCNTRQEVLIAQGDNVETDAKCKILSGSWVDPYSLVVFDNASDLDIDHVIPLSYAAQMGANSWSKEVKEQFANDQSQLLAVSAKENRSKGDKGPSKYMPPNKSFHCEYSTIWVETAYKYNIAITVKDRTALEKGLKTCS